MTTASVFLKIPARTHPSNIITRQNYSAKEPFPHQTALELTPEVHYAAYSLAFGQRGGDFATAIPSLLTDSSRCVAKMLSRSCSRYWYRSPKPTASRNCCR